MRRMSARLRAAGYYNINEESDAHCLSNISYNEKPVKVFRKRDGNYPNLPHGAKNATQANSYTTPIPAAQPPIPAAKSYVSYPASVPYDNTRLHSRYWMSEGLSRWPPINNYNSTTSTTRTSRTIRNTQTTYTYSITNRPRKDSARSSGYMRAIISALFFPMTLLSWIGAKSKSMMMHVGHLVRSRMKKTCGLLVLLILISLCGWLLSPVLTHFVDFKLPKFLPHQPSTHLDAAEEIKELIDLDMQDLTGMMSSLGNRIKEVETKNAVVKVLLETSASDRHTQGVKPPSATNNQLTPEIQQAMEKWLSYHIKEQDVFMLDDKRSGRSIGDEMADFALEVQGARVITSRCSETYRGSREFLTLFGYTMLTVDVSPRTVIQGLAPLLPGRCWSFPGAQGTYAITLSHPVKITHVTVDHVSRYNSPTGSINSAPKAFELYVSAPNTIS
ncbi:uncharacterized protein LOC128429163 [Pleuronectes platessa]|uniref:uncharacterized protein LOC128429163 n=1 Tax=Pleuronectes platessa TaxID=8262 RepID=UPI00232A15D6|nr:uncharacterized protein LOC128429163 [Pleuronectes platessa]